MKRRCGWPTNASLDHLDPARLSKLGADGRQLSGDAPSKESFLHRAMYEERPKAGAIVRLHSTHSAAVSCIDGLDADNCIPPLTAYYVMKIGRLPLIPYYRPGARERHSRLRLPALRRASRQPRAGGLWRDTRRRRQRDRRAGGNGKLFLLLRGAPTRPLDETQIEELNAAFGPAG